MTSNSEDDDTSMLDSPEDLATVYRNRKQVNFNNNTAILFKRAVKEEIWPEYKFFNLEQVNMIDLNENGTILEKVLHNLNIEKETDIYKARFFNTYGRLIPEVIANHRGGTLSHNKIRVIEGEKSFYVRILCFKKNTKQVFSVTYTTALMKRIEKRRR